MKTYKNQLTSQNVVADAFSHQETIKTPIMLVVPSPIPLLFHEL